MGGWKLEICKMALYMSFPVGLFHYFNQPEYFEEWVKNTRRQLYPPENKMHREEIEQCIKRVQEKRENELLRLLDEENSRKSKLVS